MSRCLLHSFVAAVPGTLVFLMTAALGPPPHELVHRAAFLSDAGSRFDQVSEPLDFAFCSATTSMFQDEQGTDNDQRGPSEVGTSPMATERLSSSLPVLEVLRDLESNSDAKCHSTACRFENYLFGTPLDDQARLERFDLQKELVQYIWAGSAAEAMRTGKSTVDRKTVAERIRSLFQLSEAPADLAVTFQTGAEVLIPQVRNRQYSSISYALRAILGVQQDFLAQGGPTLLSLETEAVNELEAAVNTVTLAALMEADHLAREQSSAIVSSEILRTAWRRLIPESVATGIAEFPMRSKAANESAARQMALNLFLGIIKAKRAAYEKYNDLSTVDRANLSYHNIRRFYARYAVPTEEAELDRFQLSFIRSVVQFAGSLLVESDRQASSRGHSLVRTDDAVAAVQALMPNSVDDFEDVHIFYHLSGDEQITLESYDCDSLRDFGMHWIHVSQAFRNNTNIKAIPDPFAAEVIAEAVSQYTVLILRLAGNRARDLGAFPFMTAADIVFARDQIKSLAKKHHQLPDTESVGRPIVSAPGNETHTQSVYFTDVTRKSGIEFVHRSSSWLSQFRRKEAESPPTFSGGGIASEDLNQDGNADLLFLGGEGVSLFLGDGSGQFQDVTSRVDLQLKRPDDTHGEARQPVIADFNNDGLPDILISYANDAHQLYENEGKLKFANRSATAGLGGEGLIGGPATVFDFDNDGLLDIYVCYFGDYLNGANPNHGHDSINALPNRLFRNLGNFRFADVSENSGVENTGWAQAVGHTDFDRDGWQDIVIANDFGRNALLRNMGDGTFENRAESLGVTDFYHSMNVGITDLNADGFPDIYVSNIGTMVKDNKYVMPDETTPLKFSNEAMAAMLIKEANVLYISHAEDGLLKRFTPSKQVERGSSSTGWAWDAEFLDFDNDGDDDLYVVNGNNDYNMFSRHLPGELFVDPKTGKSMDGKVIIESLDRTSNVFYVNDEGRLKNRSEISGADFAGNSRSTAYLDFDNDGDLDVAVNNFHAPATILRNNSQSLKNHWIRIRLIGNPEQKCNRDAIGARIEADLDNGQHILREIQGGSGYLSMNPKVQSFGLGSQTEVDITIVWPNGERQTVNNLSANQTHVIEQQ